MIEDKTISGEMMLDIPYKDHQARVLLQEVLQQILKGMALPPLFICIGSDRHILDCFGPLIGSMVRESNPHILIYGHLSEPLHAKNISREIEIINHLYRENMKIAIDASVGSTKDIGNIKVREGPIIPGKALSKKLAPIGDYAITGVLGSHQERNRILLGDQGTLAAVYPMARIIADAICSIYEQARE